MSQQRAERLRTRPQSALISITDPGAPPARLPAWTGPLLRVTFHDADPVTFPGANPELMAMSTGQATAVARFVLAHATEVRRFLVHCRSGISRSVGVAKAVAEITGAGFPADYAEYNRHVHRLVQQSLAAAVRDA